MANINIPIPPDRIRIANLQICWKKKCPRAPSPHLIVGFKNVKVSECQAVAISYAWGEFDRQKYVVGHDHQGQLLYMNLGQEWDVEKVIVLLEDLCAKNELDTGNRHGYLWIDQLCINNRNGEGVRHGLVNHHAIYRNLEVVIMLPVGICKCLKERFEKLKDMDSETEKSEISEFRDGMMGAWEEECCSNYMGVCSHFDRVWTFQEFQYARSLRVVRAGKVNLPCVRSKDDSDGLSGYLRLKYDHCSTTSPDIDPESELIRVTKAFRDNLFDFTEDYELKGEHDPDYSGDSGERSTLDKLRNIHALLLGYVFERIERDRLAVITFLLNLDRLKLSTRKATQARDYVLALWLGSPGYELPSDWHQMTVPNLLGDAVKQLRKNNNFTVFSNRIPGLFNNKLEKSFLWDPAKHVPSEPKDPRELYMSIAQSLVPLYVESKRYLPLKMGNPPAKPLSRHAKWHEEYFSDFASEDVLRFLRKAAQKWDSFTISRIQALAHIAKSEGVKRYGTNFNRMISVLLEWEPKEKSVKAIEALNHQQLYEAMYGVVAAAMGLELEDCRGHGLKLMIAPKKRMIGFAKRRRSGSLKEDKIITVTTVDPTEEFRASGIMEAELVGTIAENGTDRTYPRYRAVGVWVPTRGLSGFVPGAVTALRLKDYDAVLD